MLTWLEGVLSSFAEVLEGALPVLLVRECLWLPGLIRPQAASMHMH